MTTVRTHNGLDVVFPSGLIIRLRVKRGRIYAMEGDVCLSWNVIPQKNPDPTGLPYVWQQNNAMRRYLSEGDVMHLLTLRTVRSGKSNRLYKMPDGEIVEITEIFGYQKRERGISKRYERSETRHRTRNNIPSGDFLSYLDGLNGGG